MQDAINLHCMISRAWEVGKTILYLAACDHSKRKDLVANIQRLSHLLSTSVTDNILGILPVYIGMPVMVTENMDMAHSIVNGTEGIVKHISYIDRVNSLKHVLCIYVYVKDCGMRCPRLLPDMILIFMTKCSFKYNSQTINHEQLPLLSAFAYMDYKSQGRFLDLVIVNLTDSKSLQSIYVMLSHIKSLKVLAILWKFSELRIACPLSHKYRSEFERLLSLALHTEIEYRQSRHLAA